MMKRLIPLILMSSFLSLYAEDPAKPAMDMKALSYLIGHEIGSGLRTHEADYNKAEMIKGLEEGLAGKEMSLDPKVAIEIKDLFYAEMQRKQMEKRTAASTTNTDTGAVFLKENAKKEGVITTATGLQYKILRKGEGAKPTKDSTVKVHYRGTLLDGKEFDSSYKRNEPISFAVTGVIKGWTEVLQLMQVGSKVETWIPSELAYGERGAGQDIGPNSTLYFEVELLGIE